MPGELPAEGAPETDLDLYTSELARLASVEAATQVLDGKDYSTLENRIVFQKRVYLIQRLGRISFGYTFLWNRFGPYCPEAALDRMAIEDRQDEIEEVLAQATLDEEVMKELRWLRSMVELPAESKMTEAQWLELVSSLQYLADVSDPPTDEKDTGATVKRDLLDRKPHLEIFTSEVETAWERLLEAASH